MISPIYLNVMAMRYTTIIDISEYPVLYGCVSARIIYLHLVLKAGWGERNQDYCRGSIRQLQGELHMTFSAVRHGLGVLLKMGMIKKAPGGWMVRKYCPPTKPGARTMTKRQEETEKQRRRDAAELKRLSMLIDETENETAEQRAAAAAARERNEEERQKRLESGELSNISRILGKGK